MTEDPTAAAVAKRDQLLAGFRSTANYAGDFFDAFLVAGFDRTEALALVMFFLEMGHDHDV